MYTRALEHWGGWASPDLTKFWNREIHVLSCPQRCYRSTCQIPKRFGGVTSNLASLRLHEFLQWDLSPHSETLGALDMQILSDFISYIYTFMESSSMQQSFYAHNGEQGTTKCGTESLHMPHGRHSISGKMCYDKIKDQIYQQNNG